MLTEYNKPIFDIGSGDQLFGELLFGGAALLALIYCVHVARQRGEVWPLFVFAGATLTAAYEPFNNVLAHCAYPEIGQHTVFTFLNQSMPLYIVFAYMFYFAAPCTELVQRFERGMTMRDLAIAYAGAVVLCAAFEPYFVHHEYWKYIGAQPFNFIGIPLFWWFVNAMSVFAIAATYHLMREHILTRDWQSICFVVIGPLMMFAMHGSASVPAQIGINAPGELAGQLGSFGSIAIALLYMWIIGRAVTVTEPQPASIDERARPRNRTATPVAG